jgi:preprotein translocase subunit YajC
MALLFPLIALLALYLLLIRPQQQRVARQRALVQSIEVGDEVVTAGGIIGRVMRLDNDRVVIQVAPAVELTLLRGAIAQKMVEQADDDGPVDDVDDLPSEPTTHDNGAGYHGERTTGDDVGDGSP